MHVHSPFEHPEAGNKAKILGNEIPQASKSEISAVNTFPLNSSIKFNSDQLLLLSQQFKENSAGRVHPLRCYLTSKLKGQRRLRNASREGES